MKAPDRSVPAREARLPHRDTGRDTGATLVEAALVTPLFLMLLFAVFELGFVFRNTFTLENAVHEGVRAAAIKGDDATADFAILRSVEHGIEAAGTDRIDYLIVFKASGPEDAVPRSCTSSSQADLCNRYVPAHFTALLDDEAGNDTGLFRCGALDSGWCPTDRETSKSVGTDYVGVHIAFDHRYLSGIFGSSVQLSSTSILPLEPESD